ncbi:MAG TPA: type VI secretion system protein TssA [Pyrinomonadaceae bacterium]|jgi:type VI secretion system protein ImpA
MSAASEARGAGEGYGGAVVNVESLLSPIAGENPAGESLQYDGLHDEIREARRADDQLAQGEWRRERKLADWPRVVELASAALATRTKDLQLGAWLAEALVHLHGFEGLRDGLRLMRGLQLNFWEHLYPESDDGDLEARANSLAWMDRQLSAAVRHVPLTEGAGGTRYTYAEWEASRAFDIPADLSNLDSDELERIGAVREQAREEGKITSEQWRAAKNTTGRLFYETTFAALDDCWAELQALDAVTDEKFAQETPGLRALQRALEDVRALVGKVVAEKRELEPDAFPEAGAGAGDDSGAAGDDARPQDGAGRGAIPGAARGPSVASREEAYRKLAEAAAYFREAEPHSPVSYLVERAIRWGRMPLEAWLAEVIKSDDVLFALQETLGIKQPPDGAGGYSPAEGDE